MKTKTVNVMRESEVIYGFSERVKISRSSDLDLFIRAKYVDIDLLESFHVLALTRQNTILAHTTISVGGTIGCIAYPKIIFRWLLNIRGVSGFVIAHNHPSGNLMASQSDIDLTKKMKEGGKLLDLPIIDHIILSPDNKFFSFTDEGML